MPFGMSSRVQRATTLSGKDSTTDVDLVNHPPHYQSDDGGIECIEAIRAALGREGFIAFLRGQVIKYSWRLGKKHEGAIDAEKAQWYQDKLVALLNEDDQP